MPKVVDHDERREEIIRATHRVLAEGGLDALTVRTIAAAAGYSTGALNHYFENRADLLIAAYRRVFENVIARAETRREENAHDPKAALVAILDEAMPLDDERMAGTIVWFTFLGLASGNPDLRSVGRDHYRLWRAFLEDAVQDVHPDRTTKEEARRIARRLATAVAGMGVQAMFDPDRFPRDDMHSEIRHAVEREFPEPAS